MEVQGVRKAHKKGNIESNESATQIRLVSWTDFDNSGLWSCWIATSASALPETTQHHHSSLSQLFSKHPQLISILLMRGAGAACPAVCFQAIIHHGFRGFSLDPLPLSRHSRLATSTGV